MLLSVLGALLGHSAQADEIRPGYLELRQTAADTYSLLFDDTQASPDGLQVRSVRGMTTSR